MPRDNHSNDGTSRRRFFEWASAVGLAAIAPETVAEIARGAPGAEQPDAAPPTGDVYHTHVTEIPSVQQQVERFESERDPTVLYNPSLEAHLEENPDKQQFKIIVRTVGERSVVEMNGPNDRTIHGWRPSAHEIDELSDYGTIGFEPEFISTTVTLHDVDRDAIPKLPSLPFVVEVNWDPPVSFENTSVDELRGSSYFQFTDVENSISLPSWLRIRIIDQGSVLHKAG